MKWNISIRRVQLCCRPQSSFMPINSTLRSSADSKLFTPRSTTFWLFIFHIDGLIGAPKAFRAPPTPDPAELPLLASPTPPQSKKPIAMDGLSWVLQPDRLSSSLPAVVVLPVDHFPGRGVNHPNLPATGHFTRLGGHGDRSCTMISLVAVADSPPSSAQCGLLRVRLLSMRKSQAFLCLICLIFLPPML
jgi:hypothetical protein